MNTSIVVWWMILFGCQNILLCKVIVREWNVHPGSVCFMEDGSRGVCRPNCVGQSAKEYEKNICNPGQDAPIYCCVDRSFARLYPTIHENCVKRMLYQEFIERAKHKIQIEEYNYAVTYNYVTEAVKSHDKKCYEESLHLKSEDEKSDFLEPCLNVLVNNVFDSLIGFPRKGEEVVTSAGLYYNSSDGSKTLECTGTFIHRYFYLTSASCITIAKEKGKTPNLKMFASLDQYGHAHQLKSDIEKIFIHENYSSKSIHDDIAMVKGTSNFEKFHWNPNMMCLWTYDWIPSEDLSISFHSPEKRVDKIQSIKCDSDVNDNTILCNVCDLKEEVELQDELLVGPIFYNDTFQPLVPRLMGIGSFDVPCSDKKPARITLVNAYLQWIENTISAIPLNMCIRRLY